MSDRRITRLRLLQAGAVGVAGAAASGVLAEDAAAKEGVTSPAPLRFFTKWEFDTVTEMAETIWPTDDLGPGARVAGVATYIDGQLAGSWGQGHRLYLNGPFSTPQDSGHGWQIPMTPADVYRAFLPGFDNYARQTFGNAFTRLNAATQAKALDDLRTGKAVIAIGGSTAFASSDFFTLFRQNVLEGMLADPAYGGNQSMVGWKWIGFPGDPMRRGDIYFQYIFNAKPYPFRNKPLPLAPSSLTAASRGAAASPALTPPKGSKMKGMQDG